MRHLFETKESCGGAAARRALCRLVVAIGSVVAAASWPAVGADVASLVAADAALDDEARERDRARLQLQRIEERYADLREAQDGLDVAEARGETVPAADPRVVRRDTLRAEVRSGLAELAGDELETADRTAVAAMAAALTAFEPAGAAGESAVAAGALDDLTGLEQRVYEAYGRAAGAVVVGAETLDRLTVLGRLTMTDDREERRRLFLALRPVWESVDGDGGPASPYRRLVAGRAERFFAADGSVRRNLEALLGSSATDAAADDPLVTVERWLESVLAAWRDANPPAALEPWDWHHAGGELARRLGRGDLEREDLRRVHDAYYRSLGADPSRLAIRYDLEPRDGKTPVAFTTFGRRPRQRGSERGAASRRPATVEPAWLPGEAWVFATYRTGGFDNLVELLHETGHALHILAIRTRPAHADWPDSDTFTEALADLPALEAYEPDWQRRHLGEAAPLPTSLRAKYAAIVLDVAWALFEVRAHRDPTRDPNAIWAELTHEYLRITPHPELAWWAMRGQLIESPGYMMNYALGAILTAALRERWLERRAAAAPLAAAETYAWWSEELFRHGLAEPSRLTVERFLGGPLTPAALLADLARLGGNEPPSSGAPAARP